MRIHIPSPDYIHYLHEGVWVVASQDSMTIDPCAPPRPAPEPTTVEFITEGDWFKLAQRSFWDLKARERDEKLTAGHTEIRRSCYGGKP